MEIKPSNDMNIWFSNYSTDEAKLISKNTLLESLGISITEIGPDFVSGKMPIDTRTIQPAGILHGGANAALAETLGSLGAYLTINPKTHRSVGLELNINHLKAVKLGENYVFGTAKPLHLGRSTQVWEIKIENNEKQLVAISRHTVAILQL
jgi:1,4-dihydroxy-2-naphthoyl-CoA hydrolase